MLTITVHNEQGASEQFRSETKAGINAYLSHWDGPQWLTAEVRDQEGRVVATKPMGVKRIPWVPMGRPALAPEQRSVQRAIRLTPAQWAEFEHLGGLGWLRQVLTDE